MLALGDINFGLGVDTSGLGRSVRQVQQFGRSVEAAASSAAAGARQVEAALRRQEAAVTRGLQANLRFNQEARRMGVPVGMIHQANAAFDEFSKRMTRGQQTALGFQRNMTQFSSTMGKLKRDLASFDPAPNGAKFKVWLQDMTSSAVLALGPLSGVGARITALTSIISRSTVVAAAFFASITAGAYAFFKFGQAAIQTSMSLDRVRARLDGLSRSQQESAADFETIREIADQTGISFTILADQWSFIKAAAKGTTLEGDKSLTMFRNLSVAAAKFQLNGVAVEATFKAITQMMSKGTVQLEELKGQLGDQLPVAVQAAAKAMKVTTAELFKMIKAGDVATEEFLIPFSEAVAEILGVDVTKRVDTLVASIGRFNNAITFFNDRMNSAVGYSRAFKAAVELATNAVTFATNHIREIEYYLTLAGAALVGFIAPTVIGGFISLARAIGSVTLAMIGLNTAANANVLLRLVSIAAAVASAMYAMRGAFDAVGEAVNTNLSNSVSEYIELQEDMKAASRNTTRQLIKDVETQISAIETQVNAMLTARASLNAIEGRTFGKGELDFAGGSQKFKAFLGASMKSFGFDPKGTDELLGDLLPTSPEQMAEATDNLEALGSQLEVYKAQLASLGEILKKPEFGDLAKPGGAGEEASKRSVKALRDANQEITRMQQTMDAMSEGPGWFRDFERQEDINKKIQDFRDKLFDAEVPLKQVNALTLQYAETLKLLEQQTQGPFAAMQEMFSTFENSAVEAFQSITQELTKTIMTGKVNAETFVNIVKSMVARIIEEVLMLAVLNPILNSIFGSTRPTFGSGKGGGGGFLSAITSLFSAQGRAFDTAGVQFMKAGGILNGATAFQTRSGIAVGGEAGQEALMPLTRSRNGDLAVRATGTTGGNTQPIINIINGSGAPVRTRSKMSGQQPYTDIMIGEVNQAIARGSLDSGMLGRFQRRPARSGLE